MGNSLLCPEKSLGSSLFLKGLTRGVGRGEGKNVKIISKG